MTEASNLGNDAARPDFSSPVPDGGYRWWYLDAVSDDGREALTIIAFVGSVFSPYYRLASRHRPAPAEAHVAINVALYRPRGGHWAMTERGRGRLARDRDRFGLGASRLAWTSEGLTVEVDEMAVPLPRRLRGRVTLVPHACFDQVHPLDAAGHHLWQPIAPSARVEVRFEAPRMEWQGAGYLDMNWGSRPLERDFLSWDWSRAETPAGARILYDAVRRDGSRQGLALAFDAAGGCRPFEPPPRAPLPRSAWGLAGGTRSAPGAPPVLLRRLENTPFYSRSLVRTTLEGEPVTSVHESLDLGRFAHPVVQAMLPFRMPRLAG